jgi:predicted GH43/DUF377 family glycosyl hydrolase
MAYRKEDRVAGTYAEIAIVELQENFEPKPETNVLVRIPRPQPDTGLFEDPRLFVCGEKLFLGFIAATVLNGCHTACQGLVELESKTLQAKGSPVYPRVGNNFNAASAGNGVKHGEKNWTFYDNGGRVGALYMLNPVVDFPDILGDPLHVIKGNTKRRWNFGKVSGSTPLIDYSSNEWLGVFHSFTPTTGQPYRHYFAGFFTVDKRTHELTAIAKSPVMTAVPDKSRDLRPRNQSWAPNAIFPCGLVEVNNNFAVSLGWQDCKCLIRVFSRDEVEANLNRGERPLQRVKKLSSQYTCPAAWMNFPSTVVTLGNVELRVDSWPVFLQAAQALGYSEAEAEAALIAALGPQYADVRWEPAK